MTDAPARQPAIYVPHGGGPWPWMDSGRFFGRADMYDSLAAWLRSLPERLPEPPRAILVISAHWEEARPTVQTSAQPPMLYDYSGFPPETYAVKWPAPGSPELAARIRGLLGEAGIESAAAPERGFDHGTFVPLALPWPEPTIPTVQLSLVRGLDPRQHLALGRALAPLRDEGVLILGSGMSYHNMQGFFGRVPSARADSLAFDAWLAETVTGEPEAREAVLAAWEQAPRARACHPREEHLLPLMVVAGAAGGDGGSLPYREELMGTRVSAVRFG